jgi:hypothetical protein
MAFCPTDCILSRTIGNILVQKSVDWRIGFRKNVPKLIVIGIVIALVGVLLGLFIMSVFPPEELAGTGHKQTFGLTIFGLSRFVLYGGLGLVVFTVVMYIVTRTVRPTD